MTPSALILPHPASVAAELEAYAWDALYVDIPEDGADAMYLASRYADEAADSWEAEHDEKLSAVVVELARIALIPRIEAEIARREELVAQEYFRRQAQGRIDRCGCGDVPTFYGMLEQGVVR